jgi:hypothetical protein
VRELRERTSYGSEGDIKQPAVAEEFAASFADNVIYRFVPTGLAGTLSDPQKTYASSAPLTFLMPEEV